MNALRKIAVFSGVLAVLSLVSACEDKKAASKQDPKDISKPTSSTTPPTGTTTTTTPPPSSTPPPATTTEVVDVGSLSPEFEYTNKYFSIKFRKPDGWYAMDDAQRKEMMLRGAKLIAGDDKNFEAMVKASQFRTINLFSFFQYPIHQAKTFNPSILGIAESLTMTPGIKRGSDYLQHVKLLLQRSAIQYKIEDAITTARVGKLDFDVMNANTSVAGISVFQRYYVSIYKGHAVSFLVSYSTDEQKRLLEEHIKKIEIGQ